MEKTKRQLRTEAVERLKNIRDGQYPFFDSDIGAAIANGDIDNAIDMLTDESETVENADSYHLDTDSDAVNGKKCESLPDSREKLEEDVRKWLHDLVKNARLCKTATFSWDYCEFIGLLDRQAAITEREYHDTWCYECQDAHDRQTFKNIERITELQAKVDELQHELETRIEQSIGLDTANRHLEAENARLRSCISDDAEYSKLVMGEYRDLRAKVDELTEERDTYRDNMKTLEWRADRLEAELRDTDGQLRNQEHNARQSAKARAVWQERYESACEENRILRDKLRSIADDDVTVFDMRLDEVRGLKAENEQLREKLSRAYDNAHDTLRMMD